MRVMVFLATSMFIASCAMGPAEPNGLEPEADIYILAGQSNMSGRGIVPQVTPPELVPDPSIMLYGNDGVWRVANEPLDTAAAQIDTVSTDTNAGVGPGLAFAKMMRRRNPRRPIILVPCAKGGTSLKQWSPDVSRATLYGSCLARVREVTPRGRLAGLLWYQGESDARDQVSASQWGEGFEALMTAFRTDLAAPNLSILMVGIADPPKVGRFADQFPFWSIVQQEQANMTGKNMHYVSAVGLEKLDDDLHLTTKGQIDLARRMAEVWLKNPKGSSNQVPQNPAIGL
jgi:Carbohydrate esterase, sialic acid-specific acetylesterase